MKSNQSSNPPTAVGRVLITGSVRRLGAAIARALVFNNWQVVLHARVPSPQADSFKAALQECSRHPVELIFGDLAGDGAPQEVFAAALARGPLDALVNNAAIFNLQPLAAASIAEFERHWRINALVPIALTQLMAQHLRTRQAQGAVVNLLDQRIVRPAPAAAPYWVSKKALEAYTESAALGFAPLMRVNAVAPGALLLPDSPTGNEPAGRFPLAARPSLEALAEAVLYLLSAKTITGQTLFIDSGQHLL